MQEATFTIKGYECKLLKTNQEGKLPSLTVERWKDCAIAIVCLDEPELMD
jgi:hypothetical protein